MNEVTVIQGKQLPGELEDLARFVLIGRERLTAVRASIRAIERVGLAKEVHAQKLLEAQELAEAVLDAEVKIGELTAQFEKAKNQYTAKNARGNGAPSMTKEEQLKKISLSKDSAKRFEKLAAHPQAVEKAKAAAREEGRVVSRQDVLNRIVEPSGKRESVKDFVKRVEQEHQDFMEKKQESVVSFEDAQRDRENLKLIVTVTSEKILKATKAASDLALVNMFDVDKIAEVCGEAEAGELIASLMMAEKVLRSVRERLEDYIS